ncbi:hypothetical protein DQ04_04171000, partial [Trypanosoma grayi]|uniref:hypothetical protein n=1 Tax=Trypanosoma grayi TaxID=71804 RepID=UPI0004F43168
MPLPFLHCFAVLWKGHVAPCVGLDSHSLCVCVRSAHAAWCTGDGPGYSKRRRVRVVGAVRLILLFPCFCFRSWTASLSVRLRRIATTIIVSKADNFYISNMKYASVDDFLEKCALKRDPHQPEF